MLVCKSFFNLDNFSAVFFESNISVSKKEFFSSASDFSCSFDFIVSFNLSKSFSKFDKAFDFEINAIIRIIDINPIIITEPRRIIPPRVFVLISLCFFYY